MPAKPKPAAKKTAKKAAPAKPAAPNPLPTQARSFPPLALWLANPENVVRLQAIVSDPVFIAACHYVESTVDVTPGDLVGAKAALPEVIIRKAAMATGVRIFTQTITALPRYHKQDASDNPEPWDYVQAPNR